MRWSAWGVAAVILAVATASPSQDALAQSGGSWCQKCVSPGTCVNTGNGEWGYTYCEGLGNNQCEVGGYTCKWEVKSLNASSAEVVVADGSTAEMIPIAPGVWIGASCETSGTVAVLPRQGMTIASASRSTAGGR